METTLAGLSDNMTEVSACRHNRNRVLTGMGAQKTAPPSPSTLPASAGFSYFLCPFPANNAKSLQTIRNVPFPYSFQSSNEVSGRNFCCPNPPTVTVLTWFITALEDRSLAPGPPPPRRTSRLWTQTQAAEPGRGAHARRTARSTLRSATKLQSAWVPKVLQSAGPPVRTSRKLRWRPPVWPQRGLVPLECAHRPFCGKSPRGPQPRPRPSGVEMSHPFNFLLSHCCSESSALFSASRKPTTSPGRQQEAGTAGAAPEPGAFHPPCDRAGGRGAAAPSPSRP